MLLTPQQTPQIKNLPSLTEFKTLVTVLIDYFAFVIDWFVTRFNNNDSQSLHNT